MEEAVQDRTGWMEWQGISQVSHGPKMFTQFNIKSICAIPLIEKDYSMFD